MLKVSVITVVYNGADVIEKTIQSVLSQSFQNLEYIVVDGASNDGTLEVLSKYSDSISKFISEKDSGIYNAMNKGIVLSSGDYLLFLNAGDIFYSDQSLEKLISVANNHQWDFIYGKAVLEDETSGIELEFGKELVPQELNKKMPICHQAILYHDTAFQEIGNYDEQLRIKSDHEWLVRYFHLKNQDTNYQFVDEFVVRYDMIGFSVMNKDVSLREHWEIAKKYFSWPVKAKMALTYPLYYLKYKLLKRLIGGRLLNSYRKLKLKLGK
ncbi:glycosyltransferase family 2 protein [Reichenbachiella versicolor]|uniref:glycosyltransferase family 2 protein n=1 Tax=Reichenbachiella versicolor TaxID=1821036 RepID=UPI000D6EA6EC|nr:glycosyltransferase family 2 protein [Reichenbachiella versicolor]